MKYLRQEIFLGREAQKRIEHAKIAVIGLGALGSAAVNLLIRSGIKKLILVDRDIVEESNLSSQQLYSKDDIGNPKIAVATRFIKKINYTIGIDAYFEHLDYENVDIIKSDVILDCTDNLETRFLINEFSKKTGIPFVYGAAIKDKGSIFNIVENGPCLRCILKDSVTVETCETSGIINTIPSVVAALQVNEALKIITKKDFEKDLLYVRLVDNTIEKIKVKKNINCPVCHGIFEYLSGKKTGKIVRYCSSGTYLIRKEFDFSTVKSRLKKLGSKVFKDVIIYNNVTVFEKSVLVKAKSEKEALTIFSKYIGN